MNGSAPEKFSLADWGILVGIVTTLTGGLYALWRVVGLPVVRAFARKVLKGEMDQLAHNATAITNIWSAQLALQTTVDDMKPKVDRIPVIEELLVQVIANDRRGKGR